MCKGTTCLLVICKQCTNLVMRVAAELLEVLLCEENVMHVVGALEYDPELAVRQNHRAFLREHVIFKEVCCHLPLALCHSSTSGFLTV